MIEREAVLLHLKKLPATLWILLKRLPYKLMVIVVGVSFYLEEFYPFSDFPMYAGMGSKSSYFYVTDREDKPLPFKLYTGYSLTKVMKLMRTTIKRLEKEKTTLTEDQIEEIAAKEVVAFYLKVRRPRPGYETIPQKHWKIWRVESRRTGSQLEKQVRLLNEVATP